MHVVFDDERWPEYQTLLELQTHYAYLEELQQQIRLTTDPVILERLALRLAFLQADIEWTTKDLQHIAELGPRIGGLFRRWVPKQGGHMASTHNVTVDIKDSITGQVVATGHLALEYYQYDEQFMVGLHSRGEIQGQWHLNPWDFSTTSCVLRGDPVQIEDRTRQRKFDIVRNDLRQW